MNFSEWKQLFQQLDKEIDEFKGNKQQRHEKFGKRIDESYQKHQQIVFKELHRLTKGGKS